jgi:hypothetical protein
MSEDPVLIFAKSIAALASHKTFWNSLSTTCVESQQDGLDASTEFVSIVIVIPVVIWVLLFDFIAQPQSAKLKHVYGITQYLIYHPHASCKNMLPLLPTE